MLGYGLGLGLALGRAIVHLHGGRLWAERNLGGGYLEDLRLEGARGITVQIKQCQPEHLTICGSTEMELEPQ